MLEFNYDDNRSSSGCYWQCGVVNRNLTRCDRNDPSYRRVLSQYCGPVITLLTQAID